MHSLSLRLRIIYPRANFFPAPKRAASGARPWIFCLAILTCFIFLSSCPAAAQEDRWRELNAQVQKFREQDKLAEAIQVAQDSVRVAQSTFGAEHPKLAFSLNNLGLLYKQQARYAEAEPLIQRALAILEKAFGPDHSAVASSLDELASLYRAQGRYADAEPLLERALAVREKAFGPDHPAVAQSLNDLALLYASQARYADAEQLYRRSLAIREKALRPGHPSVAQSLNNLAVLYTTQGRYADAEPLYRRALAIREESFGPDHTSVADSLDDLGSLYQVQARYVEAKPLFQRALAIREKAHGPDHPAVAASISKLAGLYDTEGHYAEAEPLYRRALAIREKVHGPDHPVVAASLGNLAQLYSSQGRYADAEPLFKRALAIRENALGPDHPAVAGSLNSLAVLYDMQGRHMDAEPLYKRALAIQEKALGPGHPSVAASLNNLALLYSSQGRYSEVEPLYKRALAIQEKALGPDHWRVAIPLSNLARLYRTQGRYSEAEPLLKRALAIQEKALGPDHPTVASSLHSLAMLFYAANQPDQAAPLFDRAFASLAKQFEYYFTYMSEKERLEFLATVRLRFPLYFGFCFTYRQQFPGLVGKMYDAVLWQKGFIAENAAALRARIRASGDTESLRLLDELTAKKSEVAKLAESASEDQEQNKAASRQRIEQLEKQANELEKNLVMRSSSLAEDKKLALATWREVQMTLKPGEAAVEIVRFRFDDGHKWTDIYYYVALVVTPETTTNPKFVVLGESKKLEAAPLAGYRAQVGRTRGVVTAETTGAPANGAASDGSGAAYDAFWKPLEPALEGAKRVYISSDGVLNQIPVGLFSDSSGKLLMEKYDLRLVNSTKDLLRPLRTALSKTAVLVGNPQFDLTESEQRAALEKLNAGAQDRPLLASAGVTDTGLRSREARGGKLDPLPATQIEIEAVGKLLKNAGWQIASYTGGRALEEVLDHARSPRLVHVATHGFFLSDQEAAQRNKMSDDRPSSVEDPMLRSGLYFAGADRTESGAPPAAGLEDGVLTAYEVTQLNLQGTELVVLSACETGLGKQTNGEGVFGLRRGLQEAGAEAVLMSMWSVPDKETQELMALFYQKWLSGLDKHEAFRQAQLKERETVRQRYGKDLPFYWGAFVLVGR